MKEIFDRYKSLLRELFLYGVIGLFSASMDTLSFYLLRKARLPLLTANFLSVNVGISLSFFLNTFVNFRKTTELRKRAVRFFSIGYGGLVLSFIIMQVGVRQMRIHELVVKIVSVVIVAVFQYLFNKFITFRN